MRDSCYRCNKLVGWNGTDVIFHKFGEKSLCFGIAKWCDPNHFLQIGKILFPSDSEGALYSMVSKCDCFVLLLTIITSGAIKTSAYFVLSCLSLHCLNTLRIAFKALKCVNIALWNKNSSLSLESIRLGVQVLLSRFSPEFFLLSVVCGFSLFYNLSVV